MTGRVIAEDEFSSGASIDSQKMGADGHPAVRGHLDERTHAPDEGPPGAARNRADDGAVFFLSQPPGLLGFHLELAMDFVLVAMATKVLDMRIGLIKVGDLFTGEVGGQAFLPEEVTAFDFTFGLRRWGVTKADAVEVQSLTQLSQGVGVMGEEQAVIIDIDFQGYAVFGEGRGEGIQIGQEQFPFVDFGAGEDTAAVIEHVEHGKEFGRVGKPGVGRGVQLPEFTDPAALPTFDGRGGAVIGLGMGEVVFHGPSANLRPVDFVAATAQDFAGREAVRSRGFAAQALL